MPTVTYRHSNGTSDVVDVEPGGTLMHAAVGNGVAGILGECGGQAMCATCHVYVRAPDADALPAIGEDEEEMLECTAAPRDEQRSRLGCQVVVSDDLGWIEVEVPDAQI